MSWTDERIEILRKSWEGGMSASQIADLLAEGLTRNAVIGKAHRLGLKSRPSPVKADIKPAKPVKKTAAAKPAALRSSAKAAHAEKVPASKPAVAKVGSKIPEPKTAQSKATAIKAVVKPAANTKGAKKSEPKPPEPVVLKTDKKAKAEAKPVPVVTPVAEVRKSIFKPVVTRHQPGKKITLLDLNEKICKWPSGHPNEDDFQFCGKPVNPSTPYCLEHCAIAYQSQLPRKDRRPPPPPLASRFRV